VKNREIGLRWAGVGLLVAAIGLTLGSGTSVEATESDYVDIDLSADEDGLWLTRSGGVVETRGSAPHFGDQPPLGPGEHLTALVPTPAGDGYWLFSNKANVFAYGSAVHYGDFGDVNLAADIVAATATIDGLGYYLIGADGGVFTAGSAPYLGSVPEVLPGVVLDAPIVAISATSGGYLLVAADGGTFAFGSARFYGSIPEILPGVRLDADIVGLVPGQAGYLMIGADGGVFNFANSNFLGSLSGVVSSRVVGVAVKADLSGYLILDGSGTVWALGDARHIGVVRYNGDVGRSVPLPQIEPVIVYVRTGLDVGVPIAVRARNGAGTVVDTLVNTSGPSEGYYYLDASAAAEIQVETSGSWELEILPLSYARQWRAGSKDAVGSAPEVLRIVGAEPGWSLLVNTAGAADLIAADLAGTQSRPLVSAPSGIVAKSAVLPTWSQAVVVSIRTEAPWGLALTQPALPVTVELTGDSVAITMAINLPTSLRGTFSVTDSGIQGCGVIDTGSMMSGGKVRRNFSACANFPERWAAGVAARNPDITIVVVGAWEVFDLVRDGTVIPFGSAEHDAIVADGISRGVNALLAAGTEVALLEVPCQYPVAGGGLSPLPERGDFWRTERLNVLLRAAAAADPRVHFITSPPEFCTDVSVGNNKGLRWDGTHYGPAGGAFIWAHLRDQLLGLPR